MFSVCALKLPLYLSHARNKYDVTRETRRRSGAGDKRSRNSSLSSYVIMSDVDEGSSDQVMSSINKTKKKTDL